MKIHLAALGFFALALVLVMGDLLLQTGERALANPGDMRLNFLHLQWGIDWLWGNVPEGTEGFFAFNCFYPYRESLALSHNHSGSLPLSLLLNGLSGDWFTRGNLWVYTNLLLNAWAAFHAGWLWQGDLARRGGAAVSALDRGLLALLLGLSFAFSMARLHYIAHPQTLAHFAAPYFYLFGYRALAGKSWRAALLAGVFFGWQCLLDIHLAIFAYVLALPLLVIYALGQLARRQWRDWPRDVLSAVVCAAAAAALCVPILHPYLDTFERFGRRPLSEALHYAPDWPDLLRPSDQFALYDGLLQSASAEAVVLPSLTFLLGLGALGGWVLWRLFAGDRRLQTIAATVAGLLPVLFALDFIVHRSALQLVLRDLLPGVNSIRTPGRASLYLAPILVCTWIWLLGRSGGRRRWVRWAVLAACGWLLVESGSQRFDTWQRRQLPDLAAVFRTLSGPTIVLPDSYDPYTQLDYMEVARDYQIRLGNGYSGWTPQSFSRLRDYQAAVDPTDLIRTLLATYYDHVVVDRDKTRLPPQLLKSARLFHRFAVFDRGEIQRADQVVGWRQQDGYFDTIIPRWQF